MGKRKAARFRQEVAAGAFYASHQGGVSLKMEAWKGGMR